jgi:hypothetical protein
LKTLWGYIKPSGDTKCATSVEELPSWPGELNQRIVPYDEDIAGVFVFADAAHLEI